MTCGVLGDMVYDLLIRHNYILLWRFWLIYGSLRAHLPDESQSVVFKTRLPGIMRT